MGFGAAAFGRRFRLYSIATMVILLAAGAVTSVDAPRLDANLPTPWMGVWERVNSGVWLLWVVVLAVSMDLPFAQARWCGVAGTDKLKSLSDHKEGAFGKAYGVLIKELRLLSRSIFVIGPDDKIKYVEYVKEVTEHPNYEKALAALQEKVSV